MPRDGDEPNWTGLIRWERGAATEAKGSFIGRLQHVTTCRPDVSWKKAGNERGKHTLPCKTACDARVSSKDAIVAGLQTKRAR